MAAYRNIQMAFWTDAKVSEDFSPNEKFLYLYLLTNPLTNLCGCYEITYRQAAFDTGLEMPKIKTAMDGLMNKGVIAYSQGTKEVLVKNWHKYNWTKSEKVRCLLAEELSQIKEKRFRNYLTAIFDGTDTVSETENGDGYGIENTVTITVNNTVNDSVTEKEMSSTSDAEYPYKAIVDYLNAKTGKKFEDKSKDTRKHIKARMDEGRTLEDFFKVIDNMVAQWGGDPDMDVYLRPATLFGTKFESYLNTKPKQRASPSNRFANYPQHGYDFDALEDDLLNAQGGDT